MKQIICKIELFDLKQKIMIADLDTNEVKLLATSLNNDLGVDLAKSCQLAETFNIHLYGREDIINNQIIPQIREYINTTYGSDELEIEVN